MEGLSKRLITARWKKGNARERDKERVNEIESNWMKVLGEWGWQTDTERGRVILIWFTGKISAIVLRETEREWERERKGALSVLDLWALFTGSDNVDELTGPAGSTLVANVSLLCWRRLKGREKTRTCQPSRFSRETLDFYAPLPVFSQSPISPNFLPYFTKLQKSTNFYSIFVRNGNIRNLNPCC